MTSAEIKCKLADTDGSRRCIEQDLNNAVDVHDALILKYNKLVEEHTAAFDAMRSLKNQLTATKIQITKAKTSRSSLRRSLIKINGVFDGLINKLSEVVPDHDDIPIAPATFDSEYKWVSGEANPTGDLSKWARISAPTGLTDRQSCKEYLKNYRLMGNPDDVMEFYSPNYKYEIRLSSRVYTRKDAMEYISCYCYNLEEAVRVYFRVKQ